MPHAILSNVGRRLLNRRHFLAHAGTGLSGIALAALLVDEARAEAPGNPLAPRPPQFVPKAKRVLLIFCSGAVSHVDIFDYKPELEKRDGQPMPGADKLVTFQGAQGNLVRPLWTFRPRGQSGKMVSDLLPHLAELADEMCFIHSMTAKSNTHGPAENQMSTGFTLEGFPSAGAWVSYALGTECADLPAFVAIPDPRGVPQVGPNNWGTRVPAGRLPGDRVQRRQADPKPGPAARDLPSRGDVHARFSEAPQRPSPGEASRRHRIGGPHRQLRVGRPHAASCRRGRGPGHGVEGHARPVRRCG